MKQLQRATVHRLIYTASRQLTHTNKWLLLTVMFSMVITNDVQGPSETPFRQGRINLSRKSVHCFVGASTSFLMQKLTTFLVVVVSIHFSSMTIVTFAQWWGLQCGGASKVVGPPMWWDLQCGGTSCARAHWIIRLCFYGW